MDHPEISASIYQLAETIAADAMAADDKGFRLDAFKALTTFYVGVTRLSGRVREGDEQVIGASVPELRARIAAAGQGGEPQEAGVPRLLPGALRRAAGEARPRDRNGRYE